MNQFRANDNSRGRNSEESLVGRAHHAFRAYVKAYSLQTGQKHSYKIADDKRSASILNEAGTAVLTRTIEQFAAEGGRARLAFAGLKDIKEKFDVLFGSAGERADVRYNLDILTKSATLTVDGAIVDNHVRSGYGLQDAHRCQPGQRRHRPPQRRRPAHH